MAKLIENTYRQVNIALVNELAVLARELGVDIWESLHAAATKPFGYMPFWPGPGVGGHCIAIDPTYLSWRAGQQLGYRVEFIEHANEVNNRMPDYVVSRIAEALNDAGEADQGLHGAGRGRRVQARHRRPRSSPSLMVLERLARRGAGRVPRHVRAAMRDRRHGARFVAARRRRRRGHDIVVLLTPHADVDVHALVNTAAMVSDARG